METVSCIYISTNRKAGAKKNGIFTVVNEGRYLNCKGATPQLRSGYPLTLTGEYSDRYFVVDGMDLGLSSKEEFIRYFSGNIFKGFGKKQAEHLYDKLIGKDIEAMDDESVKNILADFRGLSEAIKKLLFEDIKGLYTRKNIEKELMAFNAGCADIELLYQKYHNTAVDRLKENPYAMVRYDVSFKLCDNIAHERGYQPDDKRRLDAIFSKLSDRLYATGSSCMSVDDAISELKGIQYASPYGYLPDMYLMSEIMASDRFVIKRYGEELRIYTKRSLYIEEHIASEIERLTTYVEYTGFKGKETDYPDLDSDQIEALKHLRTSGIKIITGGPGAGKTTLIKRYIKEYKKLNPENQFFLCAPTGRAAVRIQESSGYTAKTIHKLLGYQPYSSGDESSTMYSKANQFPVALFIVDEMSMVGEELFLKFLEAIPNGSTVILSGDPYQLRSVDPGNVLNDLIESGEIPVCELTHIHRQGAGSSIIKNYYQIKNKSTDLEYDDSFQVMHLDNEAMIKDWITRVRDCFEDITDPYSFQIVTFVKNGTYGKDTLNSMFAQQKLSLIPERERYERVYRFSNYSVGDKIMMTANNYKKGYWNGDVGIIREVSDEYIIAEFYDGLRIIDHESVEDMDHAWAATTHKSQGAEYKTILVIIDDQFPTMLYNSLILTAATRARDRVYIISVNNALEKSIMQDEPLLRNTWLDVILRERLKNDGLLSLPAAG